MSGLRYRIASKTNERLDRRQEGLPILIGLRLLAVVTLALCTVWFVSPARLQFASLGLPMALRLAGPVVGVMAVGWVIWTFHTLGHNLTDTVVTRRDATLVTEGPYRLVRHPFYVGYLGMSLFLTLVTANWLIAGAGLGVFVMMMVRTPIEERKLIERFGDAYRAYMQTTSRYLPRFS